MQLIRLALLAGVLLFGAVILFLHRQPNWKAVTLPPAVGYAQVASAVLAVCVAVAMRGRVAREVDQERRVSLLLAGWAFGEGAALFGAALFLLTGQSQWYLLGLVALAGSFTLLRIRGTA